MLNVIFAQIFLCNAPYFIQRLEQINIQYLCPIYPIEAFNKSVCVDFLGLINIAPRAL
ncbi:Uncharacterised protein [Yersinia aldovae]|nr:Uncharacterised protein [Yersinia aldovae]